MAGVLRSKVVLVATMVALALLATAGVWVAMAASPDNGTLTPNPTTGASNTIKWTGAVHPGTQTGSQDEGSHCFGSDKKPLPTAVTGCDFFVLNVSVPSGFYGKFLGGAQILVKNFGGGGPAPDIDFYIYRRNADGTADVDPSNPIDPGSIGSGATEEDPEQYTIPHAEGSFYVVVVPFATGPTQSYDGEAKMLLKPRVPIASLNARAPVGVPNYRASHDRFLSHSEPTITMDPLNHRHLVAGSKMYENLPKYLFKIGTYESFDGGRTWSDYGQLPGYCGDPAACNPADLANYRVVSDISQTMDDEGNAYSFVLDAKGGTTGSGWNMNVHIKKPGQPWSGPIVVHNNQSNELQKRLFLDDKNWIAIDNNHTPTGGVNKPRDGNIGPLYTCWGLDQGNTAPVPSVGQAIVFMRSTDGGHTWGGVAPGDNTPLVLSPKNIVAGIGCHIIVGPAGEVYVTWYDNQLDAIMQAKSTNFGQSFTPGRPVATIDGQNTPFAGQSFRNLSIPTSGVDSKGNVYIAVMSRNGSGSPVSDAAREAIEKLIDEGRLDKESLHEVVRDTAERSGATREQEGAAPQCPSASADLATVPCTDIIMFKSTNGGQSYGSPVRVNKDDPKSPTDQFQPWMAITPNGQVDVSFFDRRNDPSNFYIDTYLARSNDGGKTFTDHRISQSMWDPEINPPIDSAGNAFIGDYQGLVADDEYAVPFWNDTQWANLPRSNKEYSPYQEVVAGPTLNTPQFGGPSAGACLTGAGFAKANVHAAKHGLRFNFRRLVERTAGARVYQVAVGRRITKSKVVARFTNKKGTFTWNGRTNVRKAKLVDGGTYVATLRIALGRKTADFRRFGFRRSGGRFRLLPQFARKQSCSTLGDFALNRPVFGGTHNRRLGIYYRLRNTARVSLVVTRGKRVVRRFKARRQKSGKYRLHLSARRLPAGNYTVRIRAKRGKRTFKGRLTSRRL